MCLYICIFVNEIIQDNVEKSFIFFSEIIISDILLPCTHLGVHFQELYLPFLWQTHMKEQTQSMMLSVDSTLTSNISVTVTLGS